MQYLFCGSVISYFVPELEIPITGNGD